MGFNEAVGIGVGLLVLLMFLEFFMRGERGFLSTYMIMLILVCLVSQAKSDDSYPVPGTFLGHPKMKGIYPYMVFIEPLRCSGAIISNTWVLSAAHCFDSRYKGLMELYAGIVNEWDMKSIQFRTATWVIHPMYGVNHTLNSRFYDIALLSATRPFIFHPYVEPITLADGPLPETEGKCRAIGFGLNEKSEDGENALKWMSVLLGGKHLCHKLAHKYHYPVSMFGHHMICATILDETGKTFCSPDSGGPVVCGGVLVGVLMAAFRKNKYLTPRCGTTAAIYAYVGYHIEWIHSVVKDELFTTQIGYEGFKKSVEFESAASEMPKQQLGLVALTAIMWLILV